MNAHDALEQQLRDSVKGYRPPQQARARPTRAVVPIVMSLLVTGAVVTIAVLVLPHPREPRRSSGSPPVAGDRAIVKQSLAAVWRANPSCIPGGRRRALTPDESGSPSGSLVAAVPSLRRGGGLLLRSDLLPTQDGRPALRGGGKLYMRYITKVTAPRPLSAYFFPIGDVGAAPLTAAQAAHCQQLETSRLRADLGQVARAQRSGTLAYGTRRIAASRRALQTQHPREVLYLVTEASSTQTRPRIARISQTTSAIRQTGALGALMIGRHQAMDGFVPDGVATVKLSFPAATSNGRSLPPMSVTGTVHDNAFFIDVPGLSKRGGWPQAETWLSPAGRTIKSINERPLRR